MGISVIIPVAEKDEAWKDLIPDLKSLRAEDEIILSSKYSLKDQLALEAKRIGLFCDTQWVHSQAGRAKQLNAGARGAKNNFFWFLHCDSRISASAVEKLRTSLNRNPKAIQFFNLKFLQDGPKLMVSNEFGVWLRSNVLRLPFGDQGFCMHRDTFKKLGEFCEKAAYGEDHLFIWKAHQKQINLCCVGASIYTSARRYHSQGWFQTTARHLSFTVRQAIPEMICLVKGRMFL